MDGRALVGTALVAGLVIFMVGAVRWRRSYDKPLIESLPPIDRDGFRWRWIHVWMLAAMFVTPAAVAGFATLPATGAGRAFAAMAAIVYAIGAAVVTSDVAPAWAGWLGVAWGLVFLAGLAATRFDGPFNPPFYAHFYPAVVGGVLLAGTSPRP